MNIFPSQKKKKGVKDRVDAAVASNAGLEAAFDIQEALVQGSFAEVKSALALLSERVEVVISSGQHSSGPTDAQGVANALANDPCIRGSVTKWGGKWLNSVIAHIPRAALANPAVTRAMADAHCMPIDLTLTLASPSQATASSALAASGLAATPLPRSSASLAAPLQVSPSSSVLPSSARLGKPKLQVSVL